MFITLYISEAYPDLRPYKRKLVMKGSPAKDGSIVSVLGSYALAETIKESIGTFLKQELKMDLSGSQPMEYSF